MSTTSSDSQSKTVRRRVVLLLRALLFFGFLSTLYFGSAIAIRSVLRLSPLLFGAFLTSRQDWSNFETFELISLFASIAVVVACVARRRFFCRYLCPLGALVDFVAFIRRKTFRHKRLRFGLFAPKRILFPVFVAVWLATLVPVLFYDAPRETPTPLAFDPLSLLPRWLEGAPRILLSELAFALCFIVSPFFWRFTFCPCGALQEILFLPTRGMKALRKRFRAVVANKGATRRRRRFIGRTLAALGVFAATTAFLRKSRADDESIVFLPPGVDDPNDFALKCARCGRCLKACPTAILRATEPADLAPNARLATTIDRLARVGLPRIDFTRGAQFCDANCVACAAACPTQAIPALTAEGKRVAPIALAQFELERCMIYYQQECSICGRECPYEAIAFFWDDDEYASLPVVNSEKCVGCGRCVAACPGEPRFLDYGEEPEDDPTPPVKALRLVPRPKEQ